MAKKDTPAQPEKITLKPRKGGSTVKPAPAETTPVKETAADAKAN